MSARAVVLAVVVAASCTNERKVLDNPQFVVTSCDEAWRLATPGLPCAFDGPCSRPSPFDQQCCSDFAYCTRDVLVMDSVCQPTCACDDDSMCTFGVEECIDRRCQPCPSIEACGECPPGWIHLTRNGCETCSCAPPPQCDLPQRNCLNGEACYLGSCGGDCDPSQPGCCTTVCSAAGCIEPAPAGCYMDCPPELGCGICGADSCVCRAGTWVCNPVCADSVPFTCSAQ